MLQKTTDLLDRYLNAIKFWLPRAQQQDIIAEIAEDLHSQIDERETAPGHPLNEDDLVAILRRRGSPMRVAASYVSDHRLINPVLLPVYSLVLKIVLLWVLAPLYVIIYLAPVFTSAQPAHALLSFWNEAWRTAFMVVGIVTTVFVCLDRFHVKILGPDNWGPRKLPHVPSTQSSESRWNRLAGFIFGMLAFFLWMKVFRSHMDFSFPDGPRIIPAPVWHQLSVASTLIILATALIDGFSFIYPSKLRVRAVARMVVDGMTLSVVTILLRASNWVEIVSPGLSAEQLAKAMKWVDGSIRWTMFSIALIVLGDAIRQARSLSRSRPVSPAPLPTGF